MEQFTPLHVKKTHSPYFLLQGKFTSFFLGTINEEDVRHIDVKELKRMLLHHSCFWLPMHSMVAYLQIGSFIFESKLIF